MAKQKKAIGIKINFKQVKSYKVLKSHHLGQPLELESLNNPADNKLHENPNLKKGKRGSTYAGSYFLNFKAIEARKLKSVRELFYKQNGLKIGSLTREQENKLEIDLGFFDLNFTKEVIVHRSKDGSLRVPKLPMKGQMVDVILGYSLDSEQPDGYALDSNKENIMDVKSFNVQSAVTIENNDDDWGDDYSDSDNATESNESITESATAEAEYHEDFE